MNTKWLRAAPLAILTGAIIANNPLTAQDVVRPGPPKGCALDCKEQYLFLDGRTRSVENAFGRPVRSFTTDKKKYIVNYYEGVAVDYIELTDRRKNLQATAIFVKGNPAHARVPGLNTYGSFTIKELSYAALRDACPRLDTSLTVANLRRGVYWSPACSFGRGGAYQDFFFLFHMSSSGCQFEMAPTKKEIARCKHLNTLYPIMAVFGELDKETLQELSDINFPDW